MGRPNQAAKDKRNRERAKQERQQEKQEKKALRNQSQKEDRERLIAKGIDPDLAGIVPGPQPLSSR